MHFSLKPTFINGPGLPRNTSDYTILGSWVFDNFILADELFPKTLQNPETYISVNKSLCGKLVSSLESPITFEKSCFINIFYSWFWFIKSWIRKFKLLYWVIILILY